MKKTFPFWVFLTLIYFLVQNASAQRFFNLGAKAGVGASVTSLKVAQTNKTNPFTYKDGARAASDFFASAFVEITPTAKFSLTGGLGLRTRTVKSSFFVDGVTINTIIVQNQDTILLRNLLTKENEFTGIQTYLTGEVLARYYFNKKKYYFSQHLLQPFVGLGFRVDQRVGTISKIDYNSSFSEISAVNNSGLANKFKEDLKNGFTAHNYCLVAMAGLAVWRFNLGLEFNMDLSKNDFANLKLAQVAGQSMSSRVWYAGAFVGVNWWQE